MKSSRLIFAFALGVAVFQGCSSEGNSIVTYPTSCVGYVDSQTCLSTAACYWNSKGCLSKKKATLSYATAQPNLHVNSLASITPTLITNGAAITNCVIVSSCHLAQTWTTPPAEIGRIMDHLNR